MKKPVLIPIATAILLAVGAGESRAQQLGGRATIQTPPECARIGAVFRDLGDGLVVLGLTPGAPAARAGLQAGDRVREIDGAPATLSRLDTMVATLHPGKVVNFVVQRGPTAHALSIEAAPGSCASWSRQFGELTAALEQLESQLGQRQPTYFFRLDTARLRQETARLRLQAASQAARQYSRVYIAGQSPRIQVLDDDELAALRAAAGNAFAGAAVALELGSRSVAGMELSELNPELASYFDGVSDGLLVLRVAPHTPGALGGLVPGDVVVRAADEQVRTIAALRAIVARARGEVIPLEVVRNGKRLRLQLH